ncbi:hypothetical protein [Micromonospora humida]|uniref:Uncharacterized protein n=1 Tax=Micromonospora humida TaxID=2809018 RepID=A0ABS2J0D4_9ACTN|nr:hypothetical protein [Micromonospora humida]MBM7080030.1 hypothetical protein [Micromonospora humida]
MFFGDVHIGQLSAVIPVALACRESGRMARGGCWVPAGRGPHRVCAVPAPVPFHFAISTEGRAMAAVLDDFTWIRA